MRFGGRGSRARRGGAKRCIEAMVAGWNGAAWHRGVEGMPVSGPEVGQGRAGGVRRRRDWWYATIEGGGGVVLTDGRGQRHQMTLSQLGQSYELCGVARPAPPLSHRLAWFASAACGLAAIHRIRTRLTPSSAVSEECERSRFHLRIRPGAPWISAIGADDTPQARSCRDGLGGGGRDPG